VEIDAWAPSPARAPQGGAAAGEVVGAGAGGPPVPQLKNQLFLSRLPGMSPAQRAHEALRRFRDGMLDLPEGLTAQHLRDYRSRASDAIRRATARGPDSGERARAVQEPRIQLIDEILESGAL
jgi:hypothetical protein